MNEVLRTLHVLSTLSRYSALTGTGKRIYDAKPRVGP